MLSFSTYLGDIVDSLMKKSYTEVGFVLQPGFLNSTETQQLREVVQRFHQSWKQENVTFYSERAVNSAYLTSPRHLSESDRTALFQFIGSAKLMDTVTSIMGGGAAFMNTQLFFDPVNPAQNNYWHRDPQYHLSLAEQREALRGPNVMHFRIPLLDEPGLELVPGTHKRWDSDEELDVRLERNGRKHHEPLPDALRIELRAGDLLAFSANMIHRGIYGLDRLSLDILFCDPVADLLKFAEESCLPDKDTLNKLEDPGAFVRTLEVKRRSQGTPDSSL